MKIAPLYSLGSKRFLNFFKFEMFSNDEILPIGSSYWARLVETELSS